MIIPEIVKKILRSEKGLIVIPLQFSVAKVKWAANRCESIDDYVDLAFNIFNTFPFKHWSIRPGQVKEEITELLKILAMYDSRFILEIGTSGGGTLFLFARVSSPDAVIISIDLPGGPFGGGYREWRIPLYKSFAIHRQKMYLIREDSHARFTLNMVEKILKGHKLDFLFIDGDHTYGGVKMDFEMYSKLVRKGGMIAFHDICPHLTQTKCEVSKFWCEIKDGYEHIELIKDRKQRWAGIGVLYV